ncbi:MAG: tRNA A-37 threonylcarbamoyl transferase component Bud32 [Chlamydiales bacterium]|jgi:tRNA A-37 threonylcarbamoyl transferase component Bud32
MTIAHPGTDPAGDQDMDWESFYNNFRTPDFISGYEIQNRLGGGAFGDVYKARKQSIGKAYAIKFLKIEDDGQRQAVERELSQVRHFAAIDHPNLVSIEDLGVVMGVPYLIMGYAGEDTLARRLKAGTLDSEHALLYFVQTARGVLALHDRRLVHFDLKPSNIFLKGDVARVGDYGLSKLLTDGRTTLSYGRGTPQYMAPEILKSRADHRADIYSMGVILYEALSGELPFEGEHGSGLVLREIDDPPPFPASFPANLRPIVERCLRLSPDDRFANVGEMLEEIGQSARQGDSVRFDWSSGASDAYRPHTTPGPVAEAGSDRPTPGSANEEIRQTAADLARGAVEVARGVWDGLRSTNGNSGAASQAASAQGEAGPASRPVGETSMPRGGWRDEVKRAREGAGSSASAAASNEDEHSEPVSRTNLGADGAPVMAAIPVPPRVAGGLVGTLFSTVVVSLEVLVSLVGSLLTGSVGAVRAGWERFGRTSGGFVRRSLRFTFFMMAMSVVGFCLMTIGMFLIEAMGA